MAVNDVTRESVFTAMQEFDGLGRDRFLERYGFGPPREYFVAEGGRLYDTFDKSWRQSEIEAVKKNP